MPLPKKTKNLLSKRLSLIDDAIDSMDVQQVQIDVFKAIKRFLYKEIDVDSNGNIKKTSKNIKTLQRVRLLRNIVLSDDYRDKVGKFISTFNDVRGLSDMYIKEL